MSILPETLQQQLNKQYEENKQYGFSGTSGLFTPGQTEKLNLPEWQVQYRGPSSSYEAGEGSGSINANPFIGTPEIWEALAPFGIAEESLRLPREQKVYGGRDRAMQLRETAGYNQEAFKEAMEKAGLSWEQTRSNDWDFQRLMQDGKQIGDTSAIYNPDTGMAVPLSFMLMAFPGAGLALGSALGAGTGLAANALGNALISGTMAELGGGDFLKGAAAGGLGALGGQLIAPIAGDIGSAVGSSVGSEAVGDAVTKALTRAATSGIRATIGGKDIGDALMSGAVSGGVSSGIGDLVGQYAGGLPDQVENFISKTISDKLTSEILGTNRPSSTQNLIDAITTSGGGVGGASGGAGDGLGGFGLESLMLLPLLTQGENQQQREPSDYARTLRSPFGSILG